MIITKYKLKKLLDKANYLQQSMANFEVTLMLLNESVKELQEDLRNFEENANEERNVTKW